MAGIEDHSVYLQIRVPASLSVALKQAAEREMLPVSGYLRRALADLVGYNAVTKAVTPSSSNHGNRGA